MTVVKVRSQRGYAKSAQPWEVLSQEFRALIDRGLAQDGEVANRLETEESWRLVNVVPVTNDGNCDKELWFRKD